MKISLNILDNPYFRLGRFHKTSGLWLNVIPAWCGMIIAKPSFVEMCFLFIFIMIAGASARAAGCVINDLFDIDIDKCVERTKSRPLASGELSKQQGLYAFLIFSIPSLLIMWFVNLTALYLSFVTAFFVLLYPLTKRILKVPQIFLGITSSMGVLIGNAMVLGKVSVSAMVIFIGFIFWSMAYDTIYAYQDIKDDINLGINSSTIYYGKSSKDKIRSFFLVTLMFWLSAGIVCFLHVGYFIFLSFVSILFFIQHKQVDLSNPDSCALMFKWNVFAGLILVFGLILGVYL